MSAPTARSPTRQGLDLKQKQMLLLFCRACFLTRCAQAGRPKRCSRRRTEKKQGMAGRWSEGGMDSRLALLYIHQHRLHAGPLHPHKGVLLESHSA